MEWGFQAGEPKSTNKLEQMLSAAGTSCYSNKCSCSTSTQRSTFLEILGCPLGWTQPYRSPSVFVLFCFVTWSHCIWVLGVV